MKNRIKYRIMSLIVVIVICMEFIPVKWIYASMDQWMVDYLNTDVLHSTSDAAQRIYDSMVSYVSAYDITSRDEKKKRSRGSSRFDSTGKYIIDIPGYTTISNFKKDLLTTKNVEVLGEENINEDVEYIKTGDVVKVDNKNYTAVVLGDIDGDGKCNYRDILMEQWLHDNPDSDLVEYRNMRNRRRKTSGNCSAGSQDILDTCVEVLQYMIDNNIYYATQTYNDIEKTATEDTAFVCCTYVAVVLYKCGALTPEQINPYNYHYTHDFGNMLQNAGWQEVPHSEIQPGDIINCFGGQISASNEHVMIYAGNDACYDEVCAESLKTTEPRPDEWNWYKNLAGTTVWRAPYSNSSNSDKLKSKLEDSINKAYTNCAGKWAAYAESLDSGEQAISKNSKMNAKSLINLFVMGAVYENYSNFGSQKSNVEAKINAMITNNDMQATNDLIELLGNGNSAEGRDKVNSFCKAHGYTTTNIGKNLNQNSKQEDIYTTVSDCGKILKDIYKGELNNSQEMLNLLKQQSKKGQISEGVSKAEVISVKDELSDAEHEAAIVLADKPYILVVMSQDANNTKKAKKEIENISKSVFNYFKK